MTDGYAQWAQQYRSRLWTGVLPLPPRTKKLTIAGFTGRNGKNPDDAQIEAWCRRYANGNIALRMPGDVLGIDVDAYPYTYEETDPETGETYEVTGMKTGDLTLAALEAELGPLPATWRSSSRGDGPSGIRLFKVPPGLLWGDLGQHLEGIWWGHRYAVVYPSVNPDSDRQYEWIDDAAEMPRWGELPPKVTDLIDLPESWVARFGRAVDQVKAPRTVPNAPRRSPVADYSGSRRFTRAQAAEFVQPHLDALRHETPGGINNRLNDAAKVVSHFVPAFWSPAAADALLWDALKATAYDGKTWKGEDTIASAFSSAAGDWVAELAPDRPERVKAVRPVASGEEEPPYDEDPPSPPDDTMVEKIEGFWNRRPFLEYVEQYARSKYVAPWAVLGALMARISAAVEPNIQIPDILGDYASLNLFVALVGPSGSGKDIAFGVAKRMLDIQFGAEPLPIAEIPLGSGEGLAHIYLKRPPKLTKRRGRGDDDPDSETIGLSGLAAGGDEPIQYRTRALITISEIDTLEAIGQRRGSTLGGQLRQAWSGKQIGFMYADETRRMMVPEHSYRMSVIAGVQPGRAAALMAEADGGTPQRFLWLPATDPTISRDAPPTPGVAQWQPPVYGGSRATIFVCDEACETIIQAGVDRNSGKTDALDGHALLTRLKVAAAIAMLSGETSDRQMTVTEDDWELSGIVMAVSDRTRQGIVRHLAEAARDTNAKQALAEAQKTIVIAETLENDGVRKAVRWLRGKLGPEWLTNGELRDKAYSSALKKHLADALEHLLSQGEIEAESYQQRGREGRRYRRV